MRAIGYFRVPDEASLPDLVSAFEGFCRLNLHQPVDTFSSVGTDPGAADAECRRMLSYMRESGSEFLVVVPSAAHLGADLETVARSLVELDALGAKVTCSDEDFPNPVQNAFQSLGIKGVSPTRSRNIKESMRARALRGQALGKPPYGYRIGDDGLLEVVRDEAPVVELMYRLFTRDELGLRLIAQHLNERGITTRRGGNWNVVSIRDILKNSVYTGTYTRFGMRRPKVHEAIIPPEVFRAAQDLTRQRRPVGRVMSPESFLLSGVLICAYCGNKMLGVTRRQTWKRKDGSRARQVYRYYQCQSRNNQSRCAYHTWRTSLLEQTVVSQLALALLAMAGGAGADEGDGASRRAELRAARDARVTHAEQRFIRAMKRAARGEIGMKALGEYVGELDDARRVAVGPEDTTGIAERLAGWESLDMDARRAFIAQHVVRIVVQDDKVEVVV